jgi:tetratricopeptide (TPR) repeat protein
MYENLSLGQLLQHSGDSAAWYWIAMNYWELGDYAEAKKWLKKTMNDTGNEWASKSMFNLGQLYTMEGNLDEAIRSYEANLKKNPTASMSTIHVGILYYRKGDFVKGRELIEKGIKFLLDEDGDDSYLKPDECFKIAEMYKAEKVGAKAIEYFIKTIDRCELNYASDREFKRMAEKAIMELGG